jgi:xanthine dehydrogenase YagR molybdenum-binding subunit
MRESVIGKPVDRVDGRLKVTGSARYTSDNAPENLAHGVLIASRVGKGRIVRIDDTVAKEAPGVLLVLSHRNRPTIVMPKTDWSVPTLVGEDLEPLKDDVVHYHGQAVALVVAETFEQARYAASLVIIHYAEEQAAAAIPADHELEATTYAPAEVNDNPADYSHTEQGVASVEDAIEAAEVKWEGTYKTPFGHHHPIEPHATVAQWHGDRLTIYEPSQWLEAARNNLAAVFSIDRENVLVLSPFLGGAFGCKAPMWAHCPLAALAARELRRPVKLILTREQMFTCTGHRPVTIQKLSLGATRDGRLRAIRHDSVTTTAQTGEFIEACGHKTTAKVYRAPNIRVTQRLLRLNTGAPMWMRAPGEAPGMFALECAMDELAWKLGIDPVDLRIINHADFDPTGGAPWSSKHLLECYQQGAERFGWARGIRKIGALQDEDYLVGHGMATAFYPAYRSTSSARIIFLADGTATVSSATHELGTGMYTIMTQSAADALNIPLEMVTAHLGDSSLPSGTLAGGSKSTASILPAVKAAADTLVEKFKRLAITQPQSPFAGRNAEEIDIGEAGLTDGTRTIGYGEFLRLSGLASIEATETSAPGAEADKFAFASFGAHFVEVRVHRLTFEIRVARVVSVMDIGRVINSKTARSQVIGGVVWGIGMALMEEGLLDSQSGRFITHDLGTYHVPVNSDVRDIDVTFIDEPDQNFNPVGARGVGEIGITGVAAAIANAVYHATGRRIRDLPVTMDKLI